MAYDLNSLIRMKDLKVLAQMIKAELENGGGGSGGGSMEWPDSDDKYYAAKNGAWVEVTPAIMIETETAALPSDKYPLAFKVIAETGTDSTDTTYNLWSNSYHSSMFNYNGTTYVLGSYKRKSSSKYYYSNFLYTVKKSGYSQKSITTPTEAEWLGGSLSSGLILVKGYLYICNSSKIYTLNIAAGDNKLVELDSGYYTGQALRIGYSPTLDLIVVIFSSGYVQTMSGTPNVDMTYSARPTTPNEALNAINLSWGDNPVWSDELEIFCVGGYNGTAVSSDGLNWTSQLNIGDLRHITWVAEHHCFYAWKGNVPCMSPDGLTWVEMTAHALPNIGTSAPVGMIYVPELGIFCVMPTASSTYMLISNDLKSFAKVDIPAGFSTYGIFWDSDNKRLLTTRDIKKGTSTYYTQSILALEF